MAASPRICAYCDTAVPDGHFYCGRCGTRYGEAGDGAMQTLFYGPMQAPGRAKLMLITGAGIEGMSYHLNATHHLCGYRCGEIPFDDPYLSAPHTDFFYRDNELHVQDQASLNGTFVRLRGPHHLVDGDIIRAGDHLFRYERLALGDTVTADDGTVFYASPPPRTHFRVVEIVDGGALGRAYASPHGEVAVGREGCDLSFADDPHLSRRHFKITAGDDGDVLLDLDSRNGTFVRIREPYALRDDDYVFIGQQLLRIEIAH